MTTWLDVPADHPFGIDNLPYGVFSTAGDPTRRVGVRIGDLVLDAGAVAAIGRDAGLVGDGPDLATAWQTPSLNAFLALGRPAWTTAREWLDRDPLRRGAPRRRHAPPAPARRGRAAPADRGRRLRRLLRERGPREQRRADLPPRQRRAAAELEAPADRLPRPRGHRRRRRAPTSCVPPASARARTTRRRSSARASASTSRPSSATSSAARPPSAHGSRSTRPTTTSSASSSSTTGAPATSRPGSTSRSARSSASRSRRRSRRG